MRDLTGFQFFGCIVRELDHYVIDEHSYNYFWRVTCFCGNDFLLNRTQITYQPPKGCGCMFRWDAEHLRRWMSLQKPDKNGCINWNRTKNISMFYHEGKHYTAPRLIYQYFVSDENLDGRQVRRRCSNRRCVAPEHLYATD